MEMKRTSLEYEDKLCMILILKIQFTKKITVFTLKHVLQHNTF
jgi:hypothetical protein